LDFVTSHPKNTSRELFELMAESDKIKKHLHLPFQSGSNQILKLMGRVYTREDYIELASEYKKITNGTLGTDIIIGFPSETEADFLQTKDLVETVKFKYAFIFKYSPRLKTKAAEMADDVPEKVKSRRHKELLDLQKKISRTV
jgi:tRNA-2-methylthio-N6-dimethylallyladenosine synthase